jgi:hypothetical protein
MKLATSKKIFNLKHLKIFVFKSLGSFHDGYEGETLSAPCPASDTYIMSPSRGAFDINTVNILKFSPCSVAQFKRLLLSADLRYLWCV